MGDESRSNGSESGLRKRTRTVTTVSRLTALTLVVVGFVGAVSNDTSPVSGQTPHSVVFFVGVACAFLSIYLGIALQNH